MKNCGLSLKHPNFQFSPSSSSFIEAFELMKRRKRLLQVIVKGGKLMTYNQMLMAQYKNTANANAEIVRHNQVTEVQGSRNLDIAEQNNIMMQMYRGAEISENTRHNKATEENTRYQTDTQATTSRYNTDVQAETSRFNTAKTTDTSLKVAKMSTDTQKYSTDINAKTQKYVADTAASTSKSVAALAYKGTVYMADTSASASRYNADTNRANAQTSALASMYNTDTNYVIGFNNNLTQIKTVEMRNKNEASMNELAHKYDSVNAAANTSNAKTNEANALTNKQNANTNSLNAKTNVKNAATNSQNANTKSAQTVWDVFGDIWNKRRN